MSKDAFSAVAIYLFGLGAGLLVGFGVGLYVGGLF